jgi:hypothetical protein
MIVLEIRYYTHFKRNIKESTQSGMPTVHTLKRRETNDMGTAKLLFYFAVY